MIPTQLKAYISIIYSQLLLPCSDMYTGLLIRLVNSSSYYEGRVEVNYNGEWGTVCDDGWSYHDARVVCRQLGFGSSGTAYSNAYFGQGSGSILLDEVTCTGYETTLSNCGHLGVSNTTDCDHSEDAGVRCYPPGYIYCIHHKIHYAFLFFIH